MRWLLLSLAALAMTACNGGNSSVSVTSGSQTRIINGTAVALSDSPQMVQLTVSYPDGSQEICSGTAIGARAILTAGHCLQGALRVQLNGANPELVASNTVNGYAIHPGYFESAELGAIFNDVAVVETARDLGIPALAVITSRSAALGETVTSFGFGVDENGAYGTLRSGNTVVSEVTPNHLFSNFGGDNGSPSNPCFGDSGGPATQAVTDANGNLLGVGIVGLVSTGRNADCGEGDTTLFTNITNPEIVEFLVALVPGLMTL